MHEINYHRKYFNKLSELLIKHGWLLQKQSELDELLECNDTDDEQDLLFDLLNEFIVPDETSMTLIYGAMAQYIKDISSSVGHVIVSAFSRGREPDSGQVIVQMLKPILAQKAVEDYSIINSLDKLNKEVKENPQTKNIVIVDETVGSGQTLKDRLCYIRNLANCKDLPIHICVIASIESSLLSVINQFPNIDFFCPLCLKKGISERYSGSKFIRAKETMLQMEGKLASKVGLHSLDDYSFGYGDAQMLYSHFRWNCPNSMFPIFWWPKDKKGNVRQTLFTRALS